MKPITLFFSLLLFLIPYGQATATSVLPISLEQLSTRATLIFYGSVISNQIKKDEVSGQIATFTEFKIIELIKGEAGATHTIKQLGGHLERRQTTVFIHGVPKYKKAGNYVVFLPKASHLGFCSPLGLHQGSFTVTTIDDEQVVSNGQNLNSQAAMKTITAISRVQIPLAVDASKPSQANLYDFINTVRAYNTP